MVEIFSNYVKHMNRVEFGDYEISSLWSEIPNNNIECKLGTCVHKKWEMFCIGSSPFHPQWNLHGMEFGKKSHKYLVV
jgi:hypothetical protein